MKEEKNKPAENERNDMNRTETLALIKNAVEQYIEPNNRMTYKGALVMVAALYVGPNDANVADLTRLSIEEVSSIAHRLRASGLWNGDILNYEDWEDDRFGAIAFIMDACVAEGTLVRTGEKQGGKYLYFSTAVTDA